MFTEFTLPSNPDVKVRLREATVADAIDFSAVDPDCEEEATSLFLERVQEKESYSDPRKWTGEDRRYALFMYHVNTTKYKDMPVAFDCPTCEKRHTVDIGLASILDTYAPIKGKAFREFPHDGHNVIVHPLLGGDLESLEKYAYDLRLTEEEMDTPGISPADVKRISDSVRRKRTRMNIFRVLCSIDMPFLAPEATELERRPKVEAYIKEMPASQFSEFFERVSDAVADMRHGLQSIYKDGRIHLQIPDVRCDDNPGAPGVVLNYPFRARPLIPTI